MTVRVFFFIIMSCRVQLGQHRWSSQTVASVHREVRGLGTRNCDDFATNDSMKLCSIATERYKGFGEAARYLSRKPVESTVPCDCSAPVTAVDTIVQNDPHEMRCLCFEGVRVGVIWHYGVGFLNVLTYSPTNALTWFHAFTCFELKFFHAHAEGSSVS